MEFDDWSAIQLSLLVSTSALLLYALPCYGLGVWLAGTTRSWARFVNVLVMAPLVLPPVVTGFLLLRLMVALNLPLYFSWIGAALASGLVAMPLWIRSIRIAVEAIDPRLYIVARTLGAGRWRQHRTITLPLMRRGLIGGAVLFFGRTLGEFGAVMVVAGNTPGKTQTIPLAIFSKLNSIEPRSIWPLVAASLLLSVLLIWLSERMLRGAKPNNGVSIIPDSK